jgi:crotonobetainyl-CoA:carnitine CoA-transferase CaiB-like acyl-CoA transferase
MRKLLDGVRVIECAVLLNGDMIGALLGDLGADVIKVEDPARGDYIRDMLGQITPHHSPAHLQVNRQKRSLTVDLTTEPGLGVFWRLLETADVFIDGFLANSMNRLGIGYEAQLARRPSIVYCQHTGYGAQGPYGPIPTHGFMQDALAGVTPMEIGESGWPSPKEVDFAFAPPMTRAGPSVSTGALHAALHIVAGVVAAQRTGEGCYIDVSAAEATIATIFPTVPYDLNWERLTDMVGLPTGNVTATGPDGAARHQYYEAKDHKFVLLCAIETKFWNRFCEAVDRPDLADRRDDLPLIEWGSQDVHCWRELTELFRSRTAGQWIELAAERQLPIGPVYERPRELRNDPHLAAREIFHDAEHPDAGPFTYVASPAVIRDQPFEVGRPAPRLGQHTDEILEELGYTGPERAWLSGNAVV